LRAADGSDTVGTPAIGRKEGSDMVRIGIIGTGWASGVHLNAILKCEGARVAAVAGRNLPKAEELAAKAGGRAYGSYLEMLESERLDAVYVCLPPHLRGEVEIACSEHARAVLVEKPIGRDLETVYGCRDAFLRAGTIVSVGYHNRYRRGAGTARDFFSRPEHPPALVSGAWVGDMPSPAWWRDKALSGGQFAEQCTHVVDLARWIAGGIVEVSAMSAAGFSPAGASTVEDAVVVNARFASGAVGSFVTGCFVKDGCPARLGVGLSISSPDSLCSFSGWDFECVLKEGDRTESFPVEADIFELEARAFIEAARSGDSSTIMSGYADGIESLKVGLAANESLETGRPVGLRS